MRLSTTHHPWQSPYSAQYTGMNSRDLIDPVSCRLVTAKSLPRGRGQHVARQYRNVPLCLGLTGSGIALPNRAVGEARARQLPAEISRSGECFQYFTGADASLMLIFRQSAAVGSLILTALHVSLPLQFARKRVEVCAPADMAYCPTVQSDAVRNVHYARSVLFIV
ncbi:hypothetical protein S40288_10588 [Stachybotrys chartarum IBT 40288]|nr:hypothetical protein S40288_10588 [Stachybotrys chartarum IBT 40288]